MTSQSNLLHSIVKRFRWGLALAMLMVLVIGIAAGVVSSARAGDVKPEVDIVTWATGRVNPQALFSWMNTRSLRLDSTGKPHIAYGADHLYYARFDGANWVKEVVDSADGVGLYASLALDANNHPHISYYDANKGVLKYAVNLGSGWTISTLDATTQAADFNMAADDSLDVQDIPDRIVDTRAWRSELLAMETPEDVASAYKGRGLHTSMAVDAAGNPRISYYDSTSGDLKFAQIFMGQWQIRTVDTSDDVGKYTSLVVDSALPSNAFISYYDATNGNLKYARWDGAASSAVVQVVDSTNDVGQYTSIVLTDSSNNSDRRPRISYYDATNGDLKYAKWNGSTWEVATVLSGGDVGLYTSLVLDSSNNPRISYYHATNNDLMLVSFDTTNGWGTQLVSGDGFSGFYTSLVIDDDNKTYMSFYDGGSGQLRYAAQSSSDSWLITNVDVSTDAGLFPSVVLDHNGRPHISYLDDTRDDLMYAYWNGTAWEVRTVDASSNDVGLYSSIAVDAANNPQIAYYDSSRQCLKYAVWSVDHWVITDVECDNVGEYASLAIDQNNHAHIAYYDAKNGNLKWAYWDNAWYKYIVDAGGNQGSDKVGMYASLVVGSNNYPHIAYYDLTNQALRYARWSGTTWEILTVDNIQAGIFAAIALDPSNYAHFAYMDDEQEDRLNHAWYTSSGLYVEMVDLHTHLIGKSTPSQRPLDIAVDSSGATHISYYDYDLNNLRYARRTTHWALYLVEGTGDAGQYSSIAANSANQAVIAYYDATNGDLVYATSTIDDDTYEVYLPIARR